MTVFLILLGLLRQVLTGVIKQTVSGSGYNYLIEFAGVSGSSLPITAATDLLEDAAIEIEVRPWLP